MAKLKAKVFEAKWYHHLIVRFGWLVIIIIALGLFVPEYKYIVKPTLQMAESDQAFKVDFYQSTLKEGQEYLQGLKDLKAEIDKIDQLDLEKLDYVISSNSDLSNLLNRIYLLINESGLEMKNFSINSQSGVTTVKLSLAGSNYQTFKQFLDIVENNIQIMDITDLNLSIEQTNFDVTIKTYYQQ